MNLSMKDAIIIELALQELMTSGTDEHAKKRYQQVLDHLQAQRKQTTVADDQRHAIDGLRYDCDDASDLYEPRH